MSNCADWGDPWGQTVLTWRRGGGTGGSKRADWGGGCRCVTVLTVGACVCQTVL